MSRVPVIRIRDCHHAPLRASGRYVLYWTIAIRRLAFHYAPDRVPEHCRELGKPLVIFEAGRGRRAGGSNAFLDDGFTDYGEKRNQPELDVASGFSPYLHFGHISAGTIVRGGRDVRPSARSVM